MNIKRIKRANQYKKDRNILRNNMPKGFTKYLPVGDFYITCLLQRFYKDNKIVFK